MVVFLFHYILCDLFHQLKCFVRGVRGCIHDKGDVYFLRKRKNKQTTKRNKCTEIKVCRDKEMLFVYVVTYPFAAFRCIQSHAIERVALPFLSLSKNLCCFKGFRPVTLFIMNCYVIPQTFASPCSYANEVLDIENSD